jgi:hypothetical protein
MTTTAQKIHHYTITANVRRTGAIGAFYPVVFHLPTDTDDRDKITAAALLALEFMRYQPQNLIAIEEGPPLMVYREPDGKPVILDRLNPDTGRGQYGGRRMTLAEAARLAMA